MSAPEIPPDYLNCGPEVLSRLERQLKFFAATRKPAKPRQALRGLKREVNASNGNSQSSPDYEKQASAQFCQDIISSAFATLKAFRGTKLDAEHVKLLQKILALCMAAFQQLFSCRNSSRLSELSLLHLFSKLILHAVELRLTKFAVQQLWTLHLRVVRLLRGLQTGNYGVPVNSANPASPSKSTDTPHYPAILAYSLPIGPHAPQPSRGLVGLVVTTQQFLLQLNHHFFPTPLIPASELLAAFCAGDPPASAEIRGPAVWISLLDAAEQQTRRSLLDATLTILEKKYATSVKEPQNALLTRLARALLACHLPGPVGIDRTVEIVGNPVKTSETTKVTDVPTSEIIKCATETVSAVHKYLCNGAEFDTQTLTALYGFFRQYRETYGPLAAALDASTASTLCGVLKEARVLSLRLDGPVGPAEWDELLQDVTKAAASGGPHMGINLRMCRKVAQCATFPDAVSIILELNEAQPLLCFVRPVVQKLLSLVSSDAAFWETVEPQEALEALQTVCAAFSIPGEADCGVAAVSANTVVELCALYASVGSRLAAVKLPVAQRTPDCCATVLSLFDTLSDSIVVLHGTFRTGEVAQVVRKRAEQLANAAYATGVARKATGAADWLPFWEKSIRLHQQFAGPVDLRSSQRPVAELKWEKYILALYQQKEFSRAFPECLRLMSFVFNGNSVSPVNPIQPLFAKSGRLHSIGLVAANCVAKSTEKDVARWLSKWRSLRNTQWVYAFLEAVLTVPAVQANCPVVRELLAAFFPSEVDGDSVGDSLEDSLCEITGNSAEYAVTPAVNLARIFCLTGCIEKGISEVETEMFVLLAGCLNSAEEVVEKELNENVEAAGKTEDTKPFSSSNSVTFARAWLILATSPEKWTEYPDFPDLLDSPNSVSTSDFNTHKYTETTIYRCLRHTVAHLAAAMTPENPAEPLICLVLAATAQLHFYRFYELQQKLIVHAESWAETLPDKTLQNRIFLLLAFQRFLSCCATGNAASATQTLHLIATALSSPTPTLAAAGSPPWPAQYRLSMAVILTEYTRGMDSLADQVAQLYEQLCELWGVNLASQTSKKGKTASAATVVDHYAALSFYCIAALNKGHSLAERGLVCESSVLFRYALRLGRSLVAKLQPLRHTDFWAYHSVRHSTVAAVAEAQFQLHLLYSCVGLGSEAQLYLDQLRGNWAHVSLRERVRFECGAAAFYRRSGNVEKCTEVWRRVSAILEAQEAQPVEEFIQPLDRISCSALYSCLQLKAAAAATATASVNSAGSLRLDALCARIEHCVAVWQSAELPSGVSEEMVMRLRSLRLSHTSRPAKSRLLPNSPLSHTKNVVNPLLAAILVETVAQLPSHMLRPLLSAKLSATLAYIRDCCASPLFPKRSALLWQFIQADSSLGATRAELLADPVFSVLDDSVISVPSIAAYKSGTGNSAGSAGSSSRAASALRSLTRQTSQLSALLPSAATQLGTADLRAVSGIYHGLLCMFAALSADTTRIATVQAGVAHMFELCRSRGLSLDAKLHQMSEPSPQDLAWPLDRKRYRQWLSGVPQPREFPVLTAPGTAEPPEIPHLPPEWLVVCIDVAPHTGDLLVTRFDGGRLALTVRLPLNRHNSRDADEAAFLFRDGQQELQRIIADSDATLQYARDHAGAAEASATRQWWAQRFALDRQLAALLARADDSWFGGFKGIFQPAPQLSKPFVQFRTAFAEILARHLPSRCHGRSGSRSGSRNGAGRRTRESPGEWFTVEDSILGLFTALGPSCASASRKNELLEDLIYFVLDILQFHGEENAYDEIDVDGMYVEIDEALSRYAQRMAADEYKAEPPEKRKKRHTVLVLSRDCHRFPWECLPSLRGQSVSRVPSLEVLQRLLKDGRVEHRVPRAGGGYILNPEGDLPRSEALFKPKLAALPQWAGIIGRKPTESEFAENLSERDIFVYIGHGGGEQFIRSSTIKQLPRCAGSILIGCSSGALSTLGELEPSGLPLAYLAAGCPMVVVNMWNVTDRDIDKFTSRMLEQWGLIGIEAGDGSEGCKGDKAGEWSICEAVRDARGECKLEYLNGAAPIVYGLPLYVKEE